MSEPRSIVEEMQAYYGRRAPWYDESMRYDDPAFVAGLEPVIDLICRQLAHRSVVEIACGPGFWTRAVSAVAATITATDYNQSTLAEARRKPLDWGRVSLAAADAYRLPLAPASHDAAFAVDWLAHVPKSRLRDFLEGVHSALRPGARVVFCDQLPWPNAKTGVFDAEGNHIQERTLLDGSVYRVIKHFLSDDEIRDLCSPYSDHVGIERLEACRRIVVGYTLR
jgi:SAM-dependent methyltransferase